MKATRDGTIAVIKELIVAGVNINDKNNDGKNALWLAGFGNHYKQRLKAGNFSEKVGYLCVNQENARNSAVTFFFVARYRNYQTALQFAGFLGQRVYLGSHYLGIGCSGIGAYYDDETKEFLETSKDALYAMAIGI